MQQLIDQIAQNANLTPEQATRAAETAIAFMKDRLPAPLASQLEALLEDESTLSSLSQGLSNLLGKK